MRGEDSGYFTRHGYEPVSPIQMEFYHMSDTSYHYPDTITFSDFCNGEFPREKNKSVRSWYMTETNLPIVRNGRCETKNKDSLVPHILNGRTSHMQKSTRRTNSPPKPSLQRPPISNSRVRLSHLQLSCRERNASWASMQSRVQQDS